MRYPVAVDVSSPLLDLLHAAAPVTLGVSGGKKSTACAFATTASLETLGHKGPRILISSNPPYGRSTCNGIDDKHEMTLDQKAHLLDVLDAHRGAVVLADFQRVTAAAVAEYGRARTEVLWRNRHARHAQLAMWTQTAKEETNGK